MNIKLYNDDCLNVLKTIPDKSVDLILTDPPYDLSNHGGGHSALANRIRKLDNDISFMCNSFDMDELFPELLRVCKIPNMLIFCSNNQISRIMGYFENLGIAVNLLVWAKTNPVPNAFGSYLSDLEYCVYVHGKGACFNNDMPFEFKHRYYLGGLVTQKRFHPAQKPDELIQRYILLHSKPGDTILDCFMGSGTTGFWAKKLDRNFIGIEIDSKWYDIASKRINGAKVERGLF